MENETKSESQNVKTMSRVRFDKNIFMITILSLAIGYGIGYWQGSAAKEKELVMQHGMSWGLNPLDFFQFKLPKINNEDSESTFGFEKLFKKLWDNKNSSTEEKENSNIMDNIFNMTFDGDFERREDENFIYLEMPLDIDKGNTVDVQIQQGMIHLTKKSKDESMGGNFSSQSTQVFPIPEGSAEEGHEILHENNKLILKFHKLKEL